MDSTGGTADRILAATQTLLRRQGYAATGLQQIATDSRSRVGSIYHFFAGKEGLADAALRSSGAAYGAYVMGLLGAAEDPIASLGGAFDRAAADLVATDYADACPVATVALEVASTNETLRQATSDVFTDWIEGLSTWCRAIVSDPEAARDLATAILAALEGAFILSRTRRDPEPLLAAGRSMTRLATAMRSTATGPLRPYSEASDPA
ncbi:TetR/AcrR family transcriptional regulator [Nocardioides ferulae]|uniref:TetR/AcrR family transcriptional regulator n=1 Tax=Nocardioides ferulae TaxID=2340821 RepID=UPI000EB3304B|nr:TetR/AcrR family transcriptional regulator [Nocardioides ferulae]